ncbi:MAG: PAS domain S-box protein [SAR324 cluster bacterium]|nr:PAS domain S-box protein [SAR324 cluster bacterium]
MIDDEKSKEELILEIEQLRNQASVLQENQEYLDTILSKLPIGVAILEGEDFKYFRVNQALADMNGLPIEEHLGRTIAEVLPDAKHILPNLRRFRESGIAVSNREFSTKLPKYPDELRHLMDWLFPITIEGQTKALGVIAIDITDRVNAEGKMRLSDEILENMAEGVCLARASDGNILYTNARLEKMFGYGIRELIGMHFSKLILPEEKDPQNTVQIIKNRLQKRGRWSGEIHSIKKDGVLFWSDAVVSTFDHSIYGPVWLFVHEDISELKKTQAQLIQSTKLASLGDMASGISHELNQPLGIIGLEAELDLLDIEKGDLGNIQNSLKKIIDQVDRASIITNHLRTFGRENISVDEQESDINTLIENAFILIRAQFRLHNIKVEENLAPDLPLIRCNRSQIGQVLTNLLINARDAMKSTDKKQIWIRSTHQNGCNVIEIEDTGVGIPENQISHIFDPFFSTKEVGKGTGLGLFISYGIVEEHGGTITVSSQEGKGTNFRIELPILQTTSPEMVS